MNVSDLPITSHKSSRLLTEQTTGEFSSSVVFHIRIANGFNGLALYRRSLS